MRLEPHLHRFQAAHFGTVDDFLQTTEGDVRDTLLVACADLGTAPDNVSFAGPDRFFILQRLAASIPSAAECRGGATIADVEWALATYGLKHVVVCGHLGCEVIPHWLRPDTSDPGGFRSRFSATTRAVVDRVYPELSGSQRIERLVCEHALFQLENLQSHTFIRRKLDAGQLRLHAWVVDDPTARVHSFNPTTGQFQRI